MPPLHGGGQGFESPRLQIRAEELKEYGTRLLHVFGPANEGDLHTIV